MALKFADLKQEYSDLWNSMVIRDDKKAAVAAQAAKITANMDLYKQASDQTGVPAVVIGIIHSLEGGCDVTTHLHNGDPLTARTVHVPKGRPLTGNPPFKWVDSAVDALTMDGLAAIKDWPVERIAFELESYNGMGYRKAPGRGNTPYLWSFTNHYTKGKFKSDGHFDPNLVSEQCGAMALLKQLAGASLAPGASLASTQPPAPTVSSVVPLQSGLFFAIGPFELLPTATTQPTNPPAFEKVIEENEPVKKLSEVGEKWEIEVQLNGGGTKHGFARGGIFKAQTLDPVVDIDNFAQMCLDAARLNKTSAQHLIALADLETGIHNVAAKSGDGAGPFLISAASWTAAGVAALAPAARFDPSKQPFVAAKMAAAAATVLQPPDRLPTSAELYLGHVLGADAARKVLSDPAKPVEAAIVAAIGQPDADRIRDVRPWLFAGAMDVKTALETIAKAMDIGYVRADELLTRVEPDLEIAAAPPAGPAGAGAAAAGFAARLAAKATAEWEFFGNQTRNAAGQLTITGHKENEARVPAGSGEDYFARIGTYWREGTGVMGLDGRNSTPWSAAFISYCVKSANPSGRFHYSARHSVYISRAIRDCLDQAQDAGYWCKRLGEHQPVVGDIICWARQASIDYDHQNGGDYDGHCDIVVEVRADQIDVIGGNVGNSATKRTFKRDAGGFLVGGLIQGETLFGIMENRIP
jgi:lysozyme family protein